MQTRNKLLDDLAQLMTNAAGVAQGVRVEAETAMRSLFERWMTEANLVSREEFDAVRDMAVKAREENERLNERLEARLAELETRLSALESAKAGPRAAPRSGPKRSTH